MKIDSVQHLVQAVRATGLLEPPQLDEVQRLQTRFQDPKALARELLHRGCLTSFQVKRLFAGRSSELVLGPYVLLERIGEGGMGQVFKARHQKLGRIVALKVIRREWLSNPDAVRRFQRETRTAAQLQHPNIVHAYDADQVDERHFIAMEYIEGMDLGRLVKQSGPLPVPLACEYVRQAALGLQHAHEKGMVHRDIKPSNLLVSVGSDKAPAVKILDLGVARIPKPAQEDHGGTLTHVGAIVGTPDYMAPEQARDSRKVDIRADLYSLGCTLYHLLAGQVPFADGTGMEKVFKHQLEEPVPIEQLRSGLPRGLAAVVRKLMAKRPEDRYATPAEAAAALAPFARQAEAAALALPALQAIQPARTVRDDVTPAGGAASRSRTVPVQAIEPASSRRGLLRSLGVAVVLMALLGAAVAFWPRGKSGSASQIFGPSPVARSALDRLDRGQIPATEHPEGLPAEVVAILGDSRLRHGDRIMAVAFSADGSRIATAGHDRTVCVWDAASGNRLALIRASDLISGLAFTPDGTGVVTAYFQGFKTWDAGSGALRSSHALEALQPQFVALSPDGQHVLVGSRKDQMAHVLGTANGTRLQTITFPLSPQTQGTFTADGRLAVLLARDPRGGTAQVLLWDLKANKERGRFQPPQGPYNVSIAPDGETMAAFHPQAVRFTKAGGQALPGWPELKGGYHVTFPARGGSVMFADNGGVYLLDRATGRKQRTLPAEIGRVMAAAFSPDGQVLALASVSGRLVVWDVEAGRERFPAGPGQLQGMLTRVGFTPDGQALVGISSPNPEVVRWEFGKPAHRWTVPGNEPAWFLGVTPDLKTVIFRTLTGLVARDWASGDEKGRWTLPTGVGLGLTVLSPDGTRLAGRVGNEPTVRVLDVPSLKQRASLALGDAPSFVTFAFSGDGRNVVTADAKGRIRLWDAAAGTERPAKAPEIKGPVHRLAVNPDGTVVALSDGQHQVHLIDVASGAHHQSAVPQAAQPVRGRFFDLRFSPDGKTLLLWAGQGFQLWETATGRVKANVSWGDSLRFGPIEFAPNSRVLAQADREGRLTLWDTADGREVYHRQLPVPVWSLAFHADSRYLATGNGNGTAYILRMP